MDLDDTAAAAGVVVDAGVVVGSGSIAPMVVVTDHQYEDYDLYMRTDMLVVVLHG